MESIALIPQELIKQAERIQYALSHPNPQFSYNLPMLPIYLGTISPLNPLNKILKDLELTKVLNYI